MAKKAKASKTSKSATKGKKSSLEKRLLGLESRSNLNFYEIQKYLEEILRFRERTKDSLLLAEKRLAEVEHASQKRVPPEFEKRVDDLKINVDDRIKSMEDIVMLLELDMVKTREKTDLVPGVPTDVEDKLGVLEEKIGKIETLKIGVPAELAEHEPRMRSVEDNLLSLESRLKQEINRLENYINDKVVTEESAGPLVSKLHAEIEDVRRGIEKAELIKTEILVKEKDFAKKREFEEFSSFVHKEVETLKTLVDRVAAVETSLDRRIIDIEEKLTEDIDKHRKAFDAQLIKSEERFNQALKNETADIRALIERAGKMEKDIDSRTAAIVSKELASFSEILDKKFPGLVSRQDFEELSQEVGKRIVAIEAPDISPLARRMDELEHRIAEISKLIRTMNARLPMVVE